MLAHAGAIFALSPVPGDSGRTHPRLIIILDDTHWMDSSGRVRWTKNLFRHVDDYARRKIGNFL